jgi:hypothetical protein
MKVSFRFIVDFCGNFLDELDVTSEYHRLILSWYNKHGRYVAKSNDMENVTFEFVDDGVIECSYDISEELYNDYVRTDDLFIYHSGIADPDDDGNSPVEINGKEWLIRGFILKDGLED